MNIRKIKERGLEKAKNHEHVKNNPRSRNLPVYSELVRNLEFLLKYSSKPCSASGLPLTTALNSRSLSKRFGSFWLRDKRTV